MKKPVEEKKQYIKNGTKISRYTFFTVDVDIVNDVYKGLIRVRQMFI